VNAPDTNVLVRLLVVDDPAQTARASSMFEQGDILILKTVLLEAEWVLRSPRFHVVVQRRVFFAN
jgi:predicted nucleic-acid-binding protein